MTKLKLLSSLFCFFALSYTVTLNLGSSFGTRGNLCTNIFFKSIQPWDSTCFYSAVFNTKNALTDVHYEKYKLEKFKTKNGLSPHVAWYRSLFLRTYKNVFEYTDRELDRAHWQLMAVAPNKLEYHTAYLTYLVKQQRPAQPSLDQYCKMYFKNTVHLTRIAMQLTHLLKEEKLELDDSACLNYASAGTNESKRLSELKDVEF